MHATWTRVLAVALFLLGPLAERARASAEVPPQGIPQPIPFGEAGQLGENWEPQKHGFLAGGFGLESTESLLLGGWQLTGGLALPMSGSWSLVPRVHLSAGHGQDVGSFGWARIALDGRIHDGQRIYAEAGIGLGLLDSPVSVTNALGATRIEQRWSGTPFFQVVVGRHGRVAGGLRYMIEVTGAFARGVESPTAVELATGLEF